MQDVCFCLQRVLHSRYGIMLDLGGAWVGLVVRTATANDPGCPENTTKPGDDTLQPRCCLHEHSNSGVLCVAFRHPFQRICDCDCRIWASMYQASPRTSKLMGRKMKLVGKCRPSFHQRTLHVGCDDGCKVAGASCCNCQSPNVRGEWSPVPSSSTENGRLPFMAGIQVTTPLPCAAAPLWWRALCLPREGNRGASAPTNCFVKVPG